MKSKKSVTFLVLICILGLAAAAGYLGYIFYLGEAPLIIVKDPPSHVAAEHPFSFNLEAQAGRLSRVKVTLVQGTKFNVILDQMLGDKPGQMPAKAGVNQFNLTLEPKKTGLTQGPANLIIQSWGRAVGDFYPGKESRRDFPVTIDTVPPRISLVSRVVNIRHGGSAMVIYKLSEDATSHGVKVGDRNFPGYSAWEDNPGYGLCFFALAQDQNRDEPISLWAQDEAGNRAQRSIPVRVRRTKFRLSRINLTTDTVIALSSQINEPENTYQNDDIKSFIWINEVLRKKNDDVLTTAARNTTPKQLWRQAFMRPRGKPMAGFGDRRTYYFQKKAVTKAIHLGVDLADISQSKISSCARGKVTYAAHSGIYGNCIIIDHGLGVSSLYGHLSEMLVNVGDIVERGQVIARSGATGLALGDHLHLSVLVNGVFVIPAEWWDPHWIKDNITLRYDEASLKPPFDEEAPPASAKK